jgi:hypothetical protein
VGVKLAGLINDASEMVDGTWDMANAPDNVFRPLATGYEGETIALDDLGVRAKTRRRRLSRAVNAAPRMSSSPSNRICAG